VYCEVGVCGRLRGSGPRQLLPLRKRNETQAAQRQEPQRPCSAGLVSPPSRGGLREGLVGGQTNFFVHFPTLDGGQGEVQDGRFWWLGDSQGAIV
jgi:hypothetical protein